MCLLLTGQRCLAQQNQSVISFTRFNDIKLLILKNYKVDEGFLDTACLKTVILLKFKITDRRMDSVEFTRTTPLPIKHALEKALQLDKGGLIITDGKAFNNKTILIPITFSYLANCAPLISTLKIDSNGAISNLNAMKNRTPELALRDLLNFESGDKTAVDCILLSPMGFTSMY